MLFALMFVLEMIVKIRCYTFKGFLKTVNFMLILVTGGIIGLSLLNSIFVDAMVADNNDVPDAKGDKLCEQLDKLMEKFEGRGDES